MDDTTTLALKINEKLKIVIKEITEIGLENFEDDERIEAIAILSKLDELHPSGNYVEALKLLEDVRKIYANKRKEVN